ncbi:tripartite tricarboxylate transporter substrate binding protein [Bordetella sp. 15P40C-2]|uniref:Bug family tripartite tricarboxylate transporter substrate binding protein n=1 Tax=Bordetella sp. 15P40C-2 TaxID=2572246 RepID=UPI001324C401|nr:tripartite tricarboxylate transporter substrate binding protein [Bordetella sp. 15P40C-2]
MKFRFLICALVGGLALTGGHITAQASNDYPNKPIRMIVAYPPGGGTDALARLVGAELSKSLGQSVIVVNRAGASGAIGTQAAARAEPDGYTLLMATSNVTITPAIDATSLFQVSDFQPVTLLTESPFALVASKTLPVKSVSELIAYTKQHPKSINYASTGVGSPQHLTTESFKQREGLDWLHVPYQGGGPALTALVEGQVQVMFSNALPVVPFVESGRLVALAQTTKERLPVLPNVPTMEEAGVKDFVVAFWSGVLAPKGTPDAVINKLNTALLEVIRTPAVRDKLVSQGTIVNPVSGEAFAEYIKQDAAYWKKIADAAATQ